MNCVINYREIVFARESGTPSGPDLLNGGLFDLLLSNKLLDC